MGEVEPELSEGSAAAAAAAEAAEAARQAAARTAQQQQQQQRLLQQEQRQQQRQQQQQAALAEVSRVQQAAGVTRYKSRFASGTLPATSHKSRAARCELKR